MGIGQPAESSDADTSQGDFEVTILAHGQPKKMCVSVTKNDL